MTQPFGPRTIEGYANIEDLYHCGYFDLWVDGDWALARAEDGVDEEWEYDQPLDRWNFMRLFDGEIEVIDYESPNSH